MEWTLSTKDIEAFCQDRNNASGLLGTFFRGPQRWIDQTEKEGVILLITRAGLPPHPGATWGQRGQGRAGLRGLGGRADSPCRAGMAFHTDTGPWLANWPSDTSKKKMGNPARASIIR